MGSKDRRRLLTLFLSICLVCSALIGVQVPAFADDEVTINILHTNDVHGRFYPVDANNTGMIGIDKIAAIKDDTDNAILVDVGDAFHGLPIVNVNQGQNAVNMMTAAGYDVMTPGNHDFNYGSNRLAELAGAASGGGLTIISSNVYIQASGTSFLPTTTIITVDGVKVGFFGLTTQTTPYVTSPLNVSTLEFRDYVASAEAAILELEASGADIIVCLAHVSHSEIIDMLAALATKPDVVIEGHDHLLGSTYVDGVLVAGDGQYQENCGLVSITFDRDTSLVVDTAATYISKAETDDIAANATVHALAESIAESVRAQYLEVVAHSDVDLSSDRGTTDTPGVRNSEQALGNLVADSMRVIGVSDVAITNGGGLRADIQAGDITKGDLNSVLPFGNVLVVKEATPAALKLIMENGLQFAPVPDGRFPQISGMEVVYDPTKEAGNRVVSITIGTTVLDFNDTTTKYLLATNDFMAAGGDGYTDIQALPTVAEIDSLDSAFERYVETLAGGTITADVARIDGRISVYAEIPVTVEKNALNAAISAARALVESEYTAASWAPFMTALVAAEAVSSNQDASQDDVDRATAALAAARTALVRVNDNSTNNQNNNNNQSGPNTTPKTGDSRSLVGLGSFVLVLGLGIACLQADKKQKHLRAA
ncbi:MAG: 5'-nucleotidase C-terminal domain-containing protein [Coriobacteriia bacterium]|nr:5'-nucleotidase C-terminal domain-containing protein [Coriobacteriia bacterium]